jgi:large conductance mechanosensitive channel
MFLYFIIYIMRAEFMDFIATYNVIWVAIWLLIATKVGEWTKSFIEDFITPLIFSPILKKLKIDKLEDLSWRGVLYGKLLARTIDFIVVALVVFFVIKALGVEAK